MKFKVREIHLSWRKGRGSRRKIVGVLKRTSVNGITFKYLENGSESAKAEGFEGYPGFPLDYNKTYFEDDLDIFSLRLIPFDRKDNKYLLQFWEASDIKDKFELLALTQGILPTDNFEFLGLFYFEKKFKFVTDLAGLSHLSLEKNSVQTGDILNYKIEMSKNAYLDKAVKVYKHDKHIGYIKNIHNNIFVKSKPDAIKLIVKEIEQNGFIKNIFVIATCL